MSSDFFVAGGALPPDAPGYVKRPADAALSALISASQPGYVIAPSQMGKTSLMIHAAGEAGLKQPITTAMIYLSGLTSTAGVEAWYLALTTRLNFLLNLTINTQTWWTAHPSLPPAERFIQFLREPVLSQTFGAVVLFFDEIEALVGLNIAADFLSTLRLIYETRAAEPVFQRLNFIILGTAIPADLISNTKRSPFAVAQKIDLTDFSREEVQLLQAGLVDIDPQQAHTLFSRIYYWTGGQPYLTQKLGQAIAELIDYEGEHLADTAVDRLVEKLFFSSVGERDLNLFAIREAITTHPHRRQLLSLYRRTYEGRAVAENEQALDQQRLKLLGLVRAEKGNLKVRNLIYRQVFNLNWLKSNSPGIKPTRYLGIGLILLALAVAVGLSIAAYNRFEQVIAAQAQPYLDSFNQPTSPDTRLTSLAGLFNLPGYHEEGRQSFYQELSPEEQLSIFEQADPHSSGPDLIKVIQGVYTAPNLENNEQDNALLQAMTQPLKQLMDDPSTPESVSLELEITQWLNGRKAYNAGEYRQAVNAYRRAIELNDQNPGTFFDRSLAYAALGESGPALADLSTTLMLDEAWQPRVQQALNNNTQLYNALWAEADVPDALIGLAPSPTPTATATSTPPAPTATPTATATSTPLALTATPTATATPTPAPVTASTSTPLPAAPTTSTSAIPSGTITLLAPLSPPEPSYGPTRFVWQWSGSLTPEYGFEVRVWREGRQPTGVHNAMLDNQNGAIKNLGNNQYELNVNIKDAAGVLNNSGEYLWTVALVRIAPKYRDLGQQATPGRFLFAAPGSSGGGGDKGDGDGGGVGID
jgi:tetratricopeptide (TPR) repeat protein